MDNNDRDQDASDISFTNRQLFDILLNHPHPSKSLDSKFKYLESRILVLLECEHLSMENKRSLSRFTSTFREKWNREFRKKERFLTRHNDWLNLNTYFKKEKSYISPNTGGRPALPFGSSSERAKRLKVISLRNNSTTQELVYAAQMNFRAEGNVSASKILKSIITEPSIADNLIKTSKHVTYDKLSSDEALPLVVEANLTKSQYNLIRSQVKNKNCNIYPSYDEVLRAKKRCYPDKIILQSETEIEINLQSLLNHTSNRLVQLQRDVIASFTEVPNINLSLLCKWGFDGSSGHSEYKQKFEAETSSDTSVFLTSLVPIKLVFKNFVVWQNCRTSSPRFCRPIKLQFAKETVELTLKEKENMDNQIKNLIPFICTVGSQRISVTFQLFFTMVDGKVCNTLTNNKSTQKCYICGATSKDFSNIDQVAARPIIDENLQYGSSTLHAWIRFFECLFHLSCKMGIQKWQARGAEDKINVSESKKRIQALLRSRLGLIVDKPKPGFGSSNDGNTARRFFEHAKEVSEITKVDFNLIKRFHVVFQVLSSGYDIDVKKFKKYALETAKIFSLLYPWYVMPPTVHKILIHGSQIINSFLLPIGQLSEEAQEARNKDIKRYRLYFSRKTSRKDNTQDILNRLLVSSDPLISSLRKLPPKKCKTFFPEALNLLKSPDINLEENKENVLADISSHSSDDE